MQKQCVQNNMHLYWTTPSTEDNGHKTSLFLWRTQEFCSEGGVQQIQLRAGDRENWDLGAVAPLVRGSGGSCSLVQEISFHIVKFSSFLVL